MLVLFNVGRTWAHDQANPQAVRDARTDTVPQRWISCLMRLEIVDLGLGAKRGKCWGSRQSTPNADSAGQSAPGLAHEATREFDFPIRCRAVGTCQHPPTHLGYLPSCFDEYLGGSRAHRSFLVMPGTRAASQSSGQGRAMPCLYESTSKYLHPRINDSETLRCTGVVTCPRDAPMQQMHSSLMHISGFLHSRVLTNAPPPHFMLELCEHRPILVSPVRSSSGSRRHSTSTHHTRSYHHFKTAMARIRRLSQCCLVPPALHPSTWT